MTTQHLQITAQRLLQQAGGHPHNAHHLITWATHAQAQNNHDIGILIAQDGTLIANTQRREKGPRKNWRITEQDQKRLNIRTTVTEIAILELTHTLNQPITHIRITDFPKPMTHCARKDSLGSTERTVFMSVDQYLLTKAREILDNAGAPEAPAEPLAEWAHQAAIAQNIHVGILLSEDGTVLAHTHRADVPSHGIGPWYVTEEDQKRLHLRTAETGGAAAALRRATGKGVIHVSMRDACGFYQPAQA